MTTRRESQESYKIPGYINYSTNSLLTTPNEEMVIQNIEQLERPSYHSSKECVSEFYSHDSGHFGELLNINDTKVEGLYDNVNYIWNFEDYFTI
jgi:hypothetical protein